MLLNMSQSVCLAHVVRYNCTLGLPLYYSRRLEQEIRDLDNM